MYLSSLLSGLMFFAPIWALYVQQNLVTIQNVAFIISLQAIVGVIFELPTGAIGDIFGRKKTIVLGSFIFFISTITLYFSNAFYLFVIYAILSTLGSSLLNGTDSALIYDTLKEEGREQYYKKVNGTLQALWPLGATFASIIGGYLAQSSMSFPILITLIPLGISFILLLSLKEPKYKKAEHNDILLHLREAQAEIRGNRQILILLCSVFLLYGFGESLHILKPIFFDFKGMPLSYFGYVFALMFAGSSIGHYFSHETSEKLGDKKALIFAVFSFVLCLILATLTTELLSMFFLILSSIPFGIRNPIISHLINEQVSSNKRATILSANNVAEQLGKMACAPFVGYIADIFDINTAFLLSSIFMIPAILLILFFNKR
jgi:MFS family permease